MPKQFFTLAGVLVSMLLLIAVHYLSFDRNSVNSSIKTVAETSRMVSLSISTAFYEPRIKRVADTGNPVYPDMISAGRMDFVYAR